MEAATTPYVDLPLPGGPAAPAEARAAVTAFVGSALDDDSLGDLLVLTSEVVTNAVVHTGAGPDHEIRLLVTHSVGIVRVAVRDPDPGLALRLSSPQPGVPGGLGLALVDLLSERWGVERRNERTKEVWFEFLVSPVGQSAVVPASPVLQSREVEPVAPTGNPVSSSAPRQPRL